MTIGDGWGNSRADLTFGELQAETERLEQIDPSTPDAIKLYGLLPNGEIGVIGICVNVRIDSTSEREQESFDSVLDVLPADPEYFQRCGPAPGVEWPDD